MPGSASNADDWHDCPLFAPADAKIPQISGNDSAEAVPSAIGALSHLLYDEETPVEASELLRDEGNRHFKRGKGYVLDTHCGVELGLGCW